MPTLNKAPCVLFGRVEEHDAFRYVEGEPARRICRRAERSPERRHRGTLRWRPFYVKTLEEGDGTRHGDQSGADPFHTGTVATRCAIPDWDIARAVGKVANILGAFVAIVF